MVSREKRGFLIYKKTSNSRAGAWLYNSFLLDWKRRIFESIAQGKEYWRKSGFSKSLRTHERREGRRRKRIFEDTMQNGFFPWRSGVAPDRKRVRWRMQEDKTNKFQGEPKGASLSHGFPNQEPRRERGDWISHANEDNTNSGGSNFVRSNLINTQIVSPVRRMGFHSKNNRQIQMDPRFPNPVFRTQLANAIN